MIDRRITTGARLSFTVAHVPGVTLRLDREPAFIRTCARLRWRAHESITPGLNRTRTPPVTHSVAGHTPLGNGIAARCSSLCGGSMSRGSRNPNLSRLGTSFISQGLRLITNLVGGLKTLQSLSSLPLIHACKQPSGRVFHRFQFAPVLSMRAAHVVSSSSGAKKCPTKEFPKPENAFPRIA